MAIKYIQVANSATETAETLGYIYSVAMYLMGTAEPKTSNSTHFACNVVPLKNGEAALELDENYSLAILPQRVGVARYLVNFLLREKTEAELDTQLASYVTAGALTQAQVDAATDHKAKTYLISDVYTAASPLDITEIASVTNRVPQTRQQLEDADLLDPIPEEEV